METEPLPKRLRFAFPFTILTKPDMVRLVAGEEFRYTLRAASLEQWLPQWLTRFEREVEWRPLLDQLPGERHREAWEIIRRLYGERVLLEGTEEHPHALSSLRWAVEGSGGLRERLGATIPTISTDAANAAVFCQDNLDHAATLDFNGRCRQSGIAAWLWVSTGAMGRGYVSPVFRADAGPCLRCLIRNFERLSPAPEIYRHLAEHARAGGKIPPVPFPAPALDLLAALANWKMNSLAQPEPVCGVYRLHVVEIDTMACTPHSVFRDPHCPDCRAK
jgi:bacteriocin biosynthesis cyclodehydratase domain-containing protein